MVDMQVTKFDVSSENGAMIVDKDRDLNDGWRQSVRVHLEAELSRKVREALHHLSDDNNDDNVSSASSDDDDRATMGGQGQGHIRNRKRLLMLPAMNGNSSGRMPGSSWQMHQRLQKRKLTAAAAAAASGGQSKHGRGKLERDYSSMTSLDANRLKMLLPPTDTGRLSLLDPATTYLMACSDGGAISKAAAVVAAHRFRQTAGMMLPPGSAVTRHLMGGRLGCGSAADDLTSWRGDVILEDGDAIEGHVTSETAHENGVIDDVRLEEVFRKASTNYEDLSSKEKCDLFYLGTREGFMKALEAERQLQAEENGRNRTGSSGYLVDAFGVRRDEHGPFWPADHDGPLFAGPAVRTTRRAGQEEVASPAEPLLTTASPGLRPSAGKHFGNIEAQLWRFSGRWSGSKIVFDVLHSPRDQIPMTVGEGICPTLVFESRFESGNLQQVRRVGQFEYDLILSCDLNTIRHTQWYYFRVQNAVPGVTYLMRIVNLSKKDSLYNHGMRPLLYSETDADTKKTGWCRVGHHIRYYKNENVFCRRLMEKDRTYYMLEWQMEFPNSDDTYYLAHCYPYTFTDLKDDLDLLLRDPQRSQVMRREVLCNTRAGNSCFLVTITDFSSEKKAVRERQGVVVTARVHPGESNSSWVMKGLMDYLTGDTATAQKLRSRFVFKIVPMINPDGVIVGNYRCGLAGRDLNRNYRQPTKEAFPTVWYTKAMIEDFSRTHRILIYCDLHGHSRKQNVFMYGCGRKELLNPPSSVTGVGNDAAKPQPSSPSDAEYFLQDRLFPWLMSQRAQSRFSFDSCQFHIRKCKESTGRVTMFRQLRILNSFTMESTFCGTMLESQPRHFNAHDFEEMGRAFCDVVLQYDELLHSNRQEELDGTMDSLALEALNCMYRRRQRHEKKQTAGDEEARGGDADDVPMEFDEETVGGGTNSGETVEERRRRILSSLEQCLRSAGNDNTDRGGSSCSESSSDSDSEPESELKSTSSHLPLPRTRRKKVKLQSQRSHDRSRRSHGRDKASSRTAGDTNIRRVNSLPEKRFLTNQSETGGDEAMLRVPADSLARRLNSLPALPAIGSEAGGTADGQSHSSMADYASYTSSRTAGFEPGTSVRKSSHSTTKNQSQFINRYTGRSNGGIPMFAEERMAERAKNIASQAKKTQDDDKDKQLLPVEPLSDPFSRAKFASVKMGYQHRRHDTTLPSCQRSLFSPRKFNSDTSESMEPESEECDKGVGVTPAMTSLAARTSPYDGLYKEDAVNSSYFRPTRLLKNEPKLLPLTSLADRRPAALITSLKIEEQRSQIGSQPIMSVAASSLSYSHRVIPDS